MKGSILKGFSWMGFRRRNPLPKETDGMPQSDMVRTAPAERAESERSQPMVKNKGKEGNWIFVGNDEEGTPVYLDKDRLDRPSGAGTAPLWLKGIPAQGASSYEQARQYLKEVGADHRVFHHTEQLLQIDVQHNLVADLVLLFCDQNDHIIEQVQFRETTFRPLGAEAVYSTIKKIVEGGDEQHRSEPEADSSSPGVDEKIHLKLQEINSALEAFSRCDDADMGEPRKPVKS